MYLNKHVINLIHFETLTKKGYNAYLHRLNLQKNKKKYYHNNRSILVTKMSNKPLGLTEFQKSS